MVQLALARLQHTVHKLKNFESSSTSLLDRDASIRTQHNHIEIACVRMNAAGGTIGGIASLAGLNLPLVIGAPSWRCSRS